MEFYPVILIFNPPEANKEYFPLSRPVLAADYEYIMNVNEVKMNPEKFHDSFEKYLHGRLGGTKWLLKR